MTAPDKNAAKPPPSPPEAKPRLVLGHRYDERKDDPPPGLYWHKVRDGETLGKIADECGVRWQDIALDNFGTRQLPEVNWYLRNFVGCKKHNAKTYEFSSADKPGMILVPARRPSSLKKTAKPIKVVRGSAAEVDSLLEVSVLERVAGGDSKAIEGKWLYVFSGGPGVDFGYQPPPTPIPNPGLETPHGPANGGSGKAFDLDYSGVFPIREIADKVEYEIYISAEHAPSQGFIKTVTGKASDAQPLYKYGKCWHFLSDPKILAKATSEGRETRTSHAFRNTTSVTLDLQPKNGGRRFYFLLSPFQLGPAAIKFALANPAGLTPLLRSDNNTMQWDPASSTGPVYNQYLGPLPDNLLDSHTMTLLVIDPYAWAEDLAKHVFADSVTQYAEWITSSQNTILKELEAETGWTTDHYALARLLDVVRRSHAKPTTIERELQDKAKWENDLKTWNERIGQRNTELAAVAHRSLLGVIEWMDGPGHQIIEMALARDATSHSAQDMLDAAQGLLHWADCTENFYTLEPGVFRLRELFLKKDGFLYDVLLKHLNELDKDLPKIAIPDDHVGALRLASRAVVHFLWLQRFVSDPPAAAADSSPKAYAARLAEYERIRRDKIISLLNGFKILPFEIAVPKAPTQNFYSAGSAAVNGFLDITDKFTTYVIDRNITIPRKTKILNKLADLEVLMQKHETFAMVLNLGTTYALKVFAVTIAGYNFYTAVTTARYDYQHSVTAVSWASNSTSAIIAVQDVIAEVATFCKSQGLQRIFPQLTTTAGGPAWGIGPNTQITGIFGKTFAGVNVFAMVLSGVLTMISSYQSGRQSWDRADYTAAAFYFVGFVGGFTTAAGGAALGLTLMKVGGLFSATGAGATIGVVVFAIGGLIGIISAAGAWLFTSDDYQVFARKCFLGKNGLDEPRFNDNPPDWSYADASGTDTWPLSRQRMALMNLLSRFKLKTKPLQPFDRDKLYTGDVEFIIAPGLLTPGSGYELALRYGVEGAANTTHFTVPRQEPDAPITGPDSLFSGATASFIPGSGHQTQIAKVVIQAQALRYDSKKAPLHVTVTLHLHGEKNVLRCSKLVMERGALYGVSVDEDDVMSDVYK